MYDFYLLFVLLIGFFFSVFILFLDTHALFSKIVKNILYYLRNFWYFVQFSHLIYNLSSRGSNNVLVMSSIILYFFSFSTSLHCLFTLLINHCFSYTLFIIIYHFFIFLFLFSSYKKSTIF